VQAEFCGKLGDELIRLQQPMPDRVPVWETRGEQSAPGRGSFGLRFRLVKKRVAAMLRAPDWPLERYRALQSLQARQMGLDPCLRRRFSSSDLVQETFLRAGRALAQFRGATEGERINWLQRILANVGIDQVRKETAQQRDVALEQSLHAVVSESSARLEAYLASKGSLPSEEAMRQELLLRVAAAIERLPTDQRNVVIARELLGGAVADIAAQLGRTPKSVAGLPLQGRCALRGSLADLQ
jgi:RNA polymerase sigma-70 factor (ECF subfamily)